MPNIERLLTMGTAHGANLARHLEGGTHGGYVPDSERLQWTDVHHALSSVAPEQRAVMYLRANPELATASDTAALTTALWRALANCGTQERGASDQQAAAVVRTALTEYLDPRTCRPCRGKGYALQHVAGKGVINTPCTRCETRGMVPWSDNRRSRGCQVRRSDWTALHEHGYLVVLRTCASTYRAGVDAFKTALSGTGQYRVEDAIERRLQARV